MFIRLQSVRLNIKNLCFGLIISYVFFVNSCKWPVAGRYANGIVLVEKIIEETAPVHWEGIWKDVSHKYIPVQILKNNNRYNGWIEVSFSTAAGEFILHKAAIATQPNRDIKAGQ